MNGSFKTITSSDQESRFISERTFLDRIVKFDEKYFPQPWKLETWQSFLGSGRQWFFAWSEADDEQLNAFVLFTLNNEDSHLLKILVHPERQRRGIARSLFFHSECELRKIGLKSIFLEVETTNTMALRFYERLGFKKLHCVKSFYGNGRDAFAMNLEL